MTEERPPRQVTIRNAVIHLSNEQPLLADLFDLPSPADVGLLCTNLRMLDGKRPVFADHMASTFFFPYQHIRFVEILPPPDAAPMLESSSSRPAAAPDELEGDLEIDEDFLKRIRDV